MQGDSLYVKLPPRAPESNVVKNFIYFQEGSAKALAGAVVLLGLIATHEKHPDPADWNSEGPATLVRSLLEVSTVFETHGKGADLESTVAAIARQNAQAKTTPVTSYQWARILERLGTGFEDAVAQYNNHPEVIAWNRTHAAQDDDSKEPQGLTFDRKRHSNTKGFVELCTKETKKALNCARKHKHRRTRTHTHTHTHAHAHTHTHTENVCLRPASRVVVEEHLRGIGRLGEATQLTMSHADKARVCSIGKLEQTKANPGPVEVVMWELHAAKWEHIFIDEKLLYLSKRLWLNSEAFIPDAAPDTQSMQPLTEEASYCINWKLLITEENQHLIWRRVAADFKAATNLVSMDRRSRYRLKPEQVSDIANIIAFWVQARQFFQRQMGDQFAAYENDILTSTRRDNEILRIIKLKPAQISMSMFSSLKDAAYQKVRAQQEAQLAECASAAAEVTKAKWAHFKKALEHDQRKMKALAGAYIAVETAAHLKKISHLNDQMAQGMECVKSYMQIYYKMEHVPKLEKAIRDCHTISLKQEISKDSFTPTARNVGLSLVFCATPT